MNLLDVTRPDSEDAPPRVRLGYRPCAACERDRLDLEDGWCRDCRGEREVPDPERVAAAHRDLSRRTARMLRQRGFEAEAEWHERRAR